MNDWARAGEVTGLLRRWAEGDAQSLNRVIPIVYDELRRIASRELNRGAAGHLQTTLFLQDSRAHAGSCALGG